MELRMDLEWANSDCSSPPTSRPISVASLESLSLPASVLPISLPPSTSSRLIPLPPIPHSSLLPFPSSSASTEPLPTALPRAQAQASAPTITSTNTSSTHTPQNPMMIHRQPFPSSSSSSITNLSSNPNPNPNPNPFANPHPHPVHSHRPALLRHRRVSLPASLVQTNLHSLVGGGVMGKREASVMNMGNRLSVASMASFESLMEEGEGEVEGGADSNAGREPPGGRAEKENEAPQKAKSSPKPLTTTPTRMKRLSLPVAASSPSSLAGAYSLGGVPRRTGADIVRSSSHSRSPLGRTRSGKGRGNEMGDGIDGETKLSLEEKRKREDRRWRIAIELRETERSYWNVLKLVDSEYYQPLLASLLSSDTNARRALSTPSSPLLTPTHTTSDVPPGIPTPILNRKEINEIFSNFSDVYNLSTVILSTLDEAIPDRPSDPVALVIPVPSFSTSPPGAGAGGPSSLPTKLETLGSSTPELSSSASTLDSALHEPTTPNISATSSSTSVDSLPPLSPPAPTPSGFPQRRKTSTRPPPPPSRLGKQLLPILPFLKCYSLFIANFGGAVNRLSALESLGSSSNSAAGEGAGVGGGGGSSAERWKVFTDGLKVRGVGSGLGLGALLLNVVQRVPRYRYLLEDLLRFTEENHPDRRELKAAWEVVDQVATHLETQIQARTQELQILDLQRSFHNLTTTLLSPGRRLLKSGLLRKLDRRGNDQVRTFFLFNDCLVHASGGELSSPWTLGGGGGGHSTGEQSEKKNHRMSVGGGGVGSTMSGDGAGSGGVQYTFHRKFELESVTVVGLEESIEVGKKFGFEIRSPEKSFALYADSRETKNSWIDSIREAHSNLLRDRRTLQLGSEAPDPLLRSPRIRDRRISLPAFSGARISLPPPSPVARAPRSIHQLSLPPALDCIPPTPGDEPGKQLTDSPGLIDSFIPPSPKSSTSEPAAKPSCRREKSEGDLPGAGWSDLILPRTDSAGSIGSGSAPEMVLECRVIENYSAPVWVPDSKAEKCMSCAEGFTVWRRRHHCRICGNVVCWACSTNTFMIPSQDGIAPDRLARACDACYETVFGISPDPSLHQHPLMTSTSSPSVAGNILTPHSSGSHFINGQPVPPSDSFSSPKITSSSFENSRTSLSSDNSQTGAAATLASLLSR
ncbi:Dbl homology domain-containing protein [Meredithblackwellia eburnea MCA 4105]